MKGTFFRRFIWFLLLSINIILFSFERWCFLNKKYWRFQQRPLYKRVHPPPPQFALCISHSLAKTFRFPLLLAAQITPVKPWQLRKQASVMVAVNAAKTRFGHFYCWVFQICHTHSKQRLRASYLLNISSQISDWIKLMILHRLT